jgi:hypothetical protein
MSEWEEAKHPRRSDGEWAKKLSNKIGMDIAPNTPEGRHEAMVASMPTPTEEESDAINSYAVGTYLPINKQLRTGIPQQTATRTSVNEKIKAMDALIDRSSLPTDTVLFRGVSDIEVARKLAALKPGDTFSEGGYGSTTNRRDIAQGFDKTGVEISITAPAGSKAYAVPGTSGKEGEVLIHRGARYKVNRVMRRKNGIILNVTLES